MNGESAGARTVFEPRSRMLHRGARELAAIFPFGSQRLASGLPSSWGAGACVVARALARGGSVSRGMAGAYSAAVGGPSAGLVPSSRAPAGQARPWCWRRIMGDFGSVSTARARASLASMNSGNRSGAGAWRAPIRRPWAAPSAASGLFGSGEPPVTVRQVHHGAKSDRVPIVGQGGLRDAWENGPVRSTNRARLGDAAPGELTDSAVALIGCSLVCVLVFVPG